MFSNPDSATQVEVDGDGTRRQTNPMLLAVLAGVLALIGAFLLVRYFSQNQATGDPVADYAETSREVLVVVDHIPAGTDVSMILDSPSSYLASRAVPEQFVAPTAITTVDDLRALDGLTLASDAFGGEQLLSGRFIDRSDFTGDSVIERNAAVDVPEGHHTVVVSLESKDALGGELNFGEKVAVVSAFRFDPEDGDPFELSIVVLPAVEVIDSRTTAQVTGQFAGDADQLGRATLGNVHVTLAVEPDELTQLTYAMEYGRIILVGALPEANEDDPRQVSTIDTIVAGATFATDADLFELFGDSLVIDDGGEIQTAKGLLASDDPTDDATEDPTDDATDAAQDPGSSEPASDASDSSTDPASEG